MELNNIIESDSFIKELKEAIISGKGTDYYWDDDDNEIEYDTFHINFALEEIIKVIEKHFTNIIT